MVMKNNPSATEADSLSEYRNPKIAIIYWPKPLLVARGLVQMGLAFGKCYGLCYIDNLLECSESMLQVLNDVLCAANGIQINLSARIKPAIDIKFIERNCSNKDQQQSQRQQSQQGQDEAVVHPINQMHSPTLPDKSVLAYMKNLESHMKHVQQQQATSHRAMPNAEEFDRLVQWPGDKTIFAAHSEETHEEIHEGHHLFPTRSPPSPSVIALLHIHIGGPLLPHFTPTSCSCIALLKHYTFHSGPLLPHLTPTSCSCIALLKHCTFHSGFRVAKCSVCAETLSQVAPPPSLDTHIMLMPRPSEALHFSQWV
ncbi:hypothetical protein VNO80_13291 [Phaseolus coccineus]|uniref:Uncharacterized protein n=1 Tax=Phaseolus coccineus TaxID=3886 RepID=A0AAN9N6E7_PHACN